MSKKGGRKERERAAFAAGQASSRGYQAMAAIGGQNGDWPLSLIGEDSEVWQNIYTLRGRMRDLFRTNPYYQKYRELLWANVFGEKGIMLRMKVKETEDRVVNAPEECAYRRDYNLRRKRVRHWLRSKRGDGYYRMIRTLVRQNMIQVGDPDVYANMLIERRWEEWKRAENCDTRGQREYGEFRQLRLISGARDGDIFIRHVRDPKVNKFGYAQQLINSEWCDHFYNGTLPNGNEVRMGIEYPRMSWGLGKPVAYYFIKRQPQDWQFSIPGAFNFTSGNLHERVPAEEIIHYARYSDADSTRPAPWGASTIPKARQLDQYELAEVIAAREQACKMGYLYSDLVPEGGYQGDPIDPRRTVVQDRVPGGTQGLPYGVKYQEVDPKHPNGNFENFRKGQLRSWCAGMPGADYNIIANDLEGINFSAGRLGRLDTNEMSKMIQRFDIDRAERPTFEAWLEMGLITGAVPLPLAKFAKLNKPCFQGRRWAGVDEVKEATAAALRISNKMSSRSRECAEDGDDFEEIAFELAEEEMLLESLGLSSELSVEGVKPAQPAGDIADDGTQAGGGDDSANPKNPKAATTDAEDEKSYQEDLSKHPTINRLNGASPLTKRVNGVAAS